jgi:hypothetical protein
MNELYEGRKIKVMAELDLDADCWIPTAEIAWEENGRQNHERLTGPVGYFKIIDEAQMYAIDMAKSWIDAQSSNISREASKAPQSRTAQRYKTRRHADAPVSLSR